MFAQLTKRKIVFYVSTGLVSLMMLFSAYAYFTAEQMTASFQHLGFPGYFRIELAIAKILGVIALWIPRYRTIKEWAYAGFTFTFISAFIAHASSGDPVNTLVAPIVALVLLGASYFTSKTE